ncbi:MAG: hypothetical protein IKM21_01920 [Oscillospiraceae bacterium]|nr:hypothetical protein [Oscillospiraceae bacterium]
MSKKVYWTELIGFDNTSPDLGVSAFIERASGNIDSVALLVYNIDFVNEYDGLDTEKPLSRGACSYYGHPYNNDREIQAWTNFQVRALVSELHKHNISVLFSIFDMYPFLDEDGNEAHGPFTDKHPEIRAFNSEKFLKCETINILKRFADGSFYKDFFIEKLANVLVDFDFDGYHLADGLSSPRSPMQIGDFSDDIVSQFVSAKGISLPESISGMCDDNKKKHIARYRYIMQNLRYEFICFISDEFSTFFKKLSAKLSKLNKTIISNNAWTLDPFEALFRYGIDYKKLAHPGIDGMMLEDVGAYFSILTPAALGNVPLTPEERKLAHYTIFLTQLSTALHMPNVPHYNMTTLKDTMEDWNLIDNAPLEVKKMIFRRKNSRIVTKNGLKPVANGVFYCLSDDIKKEHWNTLFSWEEKGRAEGIVKPMGFTAIWNSDTLYAELSEFIDKRNPSSKQLYELALKGGIPISSMISAEDIDSFDGPVIAANAELYADALLAKLEKHSAPVILIGKRNPLSKKPDFTLSDGHDGFCAFFFGCKRLSGKLDLNTKNRPVSCNFKDNYNGIWTAPLRYNKPSGKFIKELKATVDSLSLAPFCANPECHILAYYTSDKSATLFINNESYGAEIFKVKFPHKIKRAYAPTKSRSYRLRFSDDTFSFQVSNRDVDIVEIEW